MTASKTYFTGLSALALVTALSAQAYSSPSLVIDQGAAGGVANGFVYYTGNALDPLVGSEIQFFSITGNDTPLNAGVSVVCTACLLNFETGTIFGAPLGPLYTFNGGGFFALEGSVGAVPTAGPVLLDGFFRNSPARPLSISVSNGTFVGFGNDIKDEDLAAFFGLGPAFTYTNTTIYADTIVFNPAVATAFDLFDLDARCPGLDCPYTDNVDVVTIGPGGFLMSVNTGDITNVPAPEPGSALLLLLGLGSLAAYRRRR
jgi:hypothetical protein